jgi:hypothetical protein
VRRRVLSLSLKTTLASLRALKKIKLKNNKGKLENLLAFKKMFEIILNLNKYQPSRP